MRRCGAVFALIVVGLFVAAQASARSAGTVTSHEGDARVESRATVLDRSRVRFSVICPAQTSTVCQGKAWLTTRDLIATRKGGSRRRVTIARGTFANLQPGQSVALEVPLRHEARTYVLRHRSISALGRVVNEKPSGPTPTVQPVTLVNRIHP
jgi:hypothetical protein